MDRSAKFALGTMLTIVLVVSISALGRREGAPRKDSPSPFAGPSAPAEKPAQPDPVPDATTAKAR